MFYIDIRSRENIWRWYMINLTNKIIVVTGASRGIGAAICRHLADEGARLVLTGRNMKRLRETAASLNLDKRDYHIVRADITKKAEMKKIVSSAMRKFGRIDIFINNAGVGIHKPVTEHTEKEYDLIFNTNLKAVYYSFLELIPLYRKQGGGQIINISSGAGRMGERRRTRVGGHASENSHSRKLPALGVCSGIRD